MRQENREEMGCRVQTEDRSQVEEKWRSCGGYDEGGGAPCTCTQAR